MLTTIRGDRFGLNPDLVEEIRSVGTGTAISLITGRSYSSSEDVETVGRLLVDYRIEILRSVDAGTNLMAKGD